MKILVELLPFGSAYASEQRGLNDAPGQMQTILVASWSKGPDLVRSLRRGARTTNRQKQSVAAAAGDEIDFHANVDVLRPETVKPRIEKLLAVEERCRIFILHWASTLRIKDRFQQFGKVLGCPCSRFRVYGCKPVGLLQQHLFACCNGQFFGAFIPVIPDREIFAMPLGHGIHGGHPCNLFALLD